MNRQHPLKADDLTAQFVKRTAVENERQQEREATLRWISDSALEKFRHAWRQ
jgi:hypothetical protein